jgi:hypothetical protein
MDFSGSYAGPGVSLHYTITFTSGSTAVGSATIER